MSERVAYGIDPREVKEGVGTIVKDHLVDGLEQHDVVTRPQVVSLPPEKHEDLLHLPCGDIVHTQFFNELHNGC